MSNNFDFICVSGYGKSGSGACVDLLKEFEFIDGINKEFRIAKDPYGILDLEFSLVDNWEFVRHNMAITDFLKYCSVLSRNDGLFKKTGKNFSHLLYVDFMKESEEYINRINDFKYIGDTLISRYYLNSIQSFMQRLRSKFSLNNALNMYFSRPSYSKFEVETNRYIKNLFKNYADHNNLYKVVLDQAISPININKTIRFFDNSKLIIVDRDPRDIYATMIREKRLLGSDVLSNKSVDKYISWHHTVRKQVKNDLNTTNIKENILKLKYEDFFVNYDNTIKKLREFLNIDYFQ